ncbi:hypothetical protein HNR44_002744 [Geomicrobium halophilum]|uniref:Uncharacterized protein n=1 Tax=Geomicrobium halophilum TaxID=549000 RepID=A0A841PSJ0_9BACL|nr:hypothetical protein [Geomicrobium halophilum]MBB6450754.1 hypothetical protein [Geomicrobium halophilum]
MKVLGIALFMFVTIMSMTLGFDLIIGVDVALESFSPIYVMETFELMVTLVFLLSLLVTPVLSFLRKRRKE